MADTYFDILADIIAKLGEIAGVGKIHDHQRQIYDQAKYIAAFKDSDGRIRGWEVTRGPVTEHNRGPFFRHHRFILRGHLGLEDAAATDKPWQALIDTICAKFRNADPADLTAAWGYYNGDSGEEAPCQVPVNDQRVFGQVLCHYAEIHLSVTERIVA